MRRLGIALLLVVGLIIPGARAVSARQDHPSQTIGYVVRPSDTLWSIARARAGSGDVRRTVYRLTELNNLGSRPLLAGQRLRLPMR